jgi:hypothetical protein
MSKIRNSTIFLALPPDVKERASVCVHMQEGEAVRYDLIDKSTVKTPALEEIVAASHDTEVKRVLTVNWAAGIHGK